MSRWRSTRSLVARPASRSSCQSGSSPTTEARLSRIVVVALRKLRRSWVSARALPAAAGNLVPAGTGALTVVPHSFGIHLSTRRLTRWKSLGRGQELGQVQGAYAGAQPGQPAADVHEAGVVACGTDLGAGVQNVAHLAVSYTRLTLPT